jgi:hypothetical protein
VKGRERAHSSERLALRFEQGQHVRVLGELLFDSPFVICGLARFKSIGETKTGRRTYLPQRRLDVVLD